MLDIKPYLPYYVGQDFNITGGSEFYQAHRLIGKTITIDSGHISLIQKDILQGTLHLRRLSSLTETEAYRSVNFDRLSASQFHYLLSIGLWLFGDEYFTDGLIKEKK